MIQSSEYIQLISRAQDRNWSKETAPCYTETHHIIPKCCNGTDDPDNLVELTLNEHYLAHLYLAVANDNHGGLLTSVRVIEGRLPLSSKLYEQDIEWKEYALSKYKEYCSVRSKAMWNNTKYKELQSKIRKAQWCCDEYRDSWFTSRRANSTSVYVTPLGEFKLQSDAAKAHGISKEALRRRINHTNNKWIDYYAK